MEDASVDCSDFICGELARLLKRPSMARDEKFSALQADSILVLRLRTAIETEFRVSLDIVDMFLAEEVGDIADLVNDRLAERRGA